MNVYDLKGNFTYAMHGCGAYQGILHSNSVDALEYWRRKGVKFFEIDVALASDGCHVAIAHGLSDDYLRHWEIYNAPQSENRTSSWFLTQRLCHLSSRGLRTMRVSDIIEWLKSDEEIIVMFDLYNLWSNAAGALAREIQSLISDCEYLWDRILIECYFQDQAEAVKLVSNSINIIFCVNDKSAQHYRVEQISIERLKELGVGYISYPWKYVNSEEDIKKFVDAGFVVMSLVRSNFSSQKLKKAGVSIVNVDILFGRFSILWQLPSFLIGRIRYYSVKVYDRYIRK